METSLRYFIQILSVVTAFDIPEDECLRAAGLSALPETERVSADALAQILNFAARRQNDPIIGIKCAQKFPILQYTRPAEFLKLCDNIDHAMDVYSRYCPLFHTVGTPSKVISEEGHDRMIWVPNFTPDQTEDYRQFIELIMTNYVTSINWLAWKIPNAVQLVNIKHKAVLPVERYEALMGCAVKFEQSEYSVILKEGVKTAPFTTSDPAQLAKVRINFDLALNKLLEKDSLIDRIELQIRLCVGQTDLNKASIAKALDVSQRSMTRGLAEKGTSFKDIKKRVLQDLAVAKINEGLPLAEVAQSLGYNDQAAFTRAYKKWFGSPPGKHNAPRRE